MKLAANRMLTVGAGATILLFSVLHSSGCVRVQPQVVDLHVQLENQVFGRLEQLQSEVVLLSSVRGGAASEEHSDTAAGRRSPLELEARQAAQLRAFYADDIAELKRRRLVGEGLQGELVILEQARSEAQRRRVAALVQRENSARLTLMRRALQLTPGLSMADLPLARRLFRRLVRSTARPGERVQDEDGTWRSLAQP